MYRFSSSLLVFSALGLIVFNSANAQTTAAAPRIKEAADDTRLVTLKRNTHPLAQSQFDRGAAPANLPMERMQLVLTRDARQQSALKALIDAQHDNSSSSFHQWLTPEQFGQQFGAADQDVQAVATWLQSHGFRVNHVAKGRTVIEFSGTAGQVRSAFHTEIRKFVVNGEEHWANSVDPQIPAALRPVVAGVAKLHNFRTKSMAKVSSKWPTVPTSLGVRPQYNQDDGSHALTPADYAVIYNINPLYKAGINGSGVTIGVIGIGPIIVQDIVDFRRVFGLPKNPPQVIVNGTAPDYWQYEPPDVEGTLDVTWAGAVAPKATIKFITSKYTDSTDGLDLSEEYAVDNNVADILTESFGLCEADISDANQQLLDSLREQAAAQGITWMVSSGDSGPYTCYGDSDTSIGPVSVNGFASSPYVVAVGGTGFSTSANTSAYWSATNTATTFASALSYVPETAWNDSCDAAKCGKDNVIVAAGGGGSSSLFARPSWQSGVAGIPAGNTRDLPDVSMAASGLNTPYLICYLESCSFPPIDSSSFFPVGGTSASSPAFAGVMALVNQKMKSRQGQANYVLYRLAASQQNSQCDGSNTKTLPAGGCIFNDITAGNIAVPDEPKYGKPGALYQAGVGYDLATGLGSVNVANLVNHWNTVTFSATQTSLAINPTTLKHGESASFQIAVTPRSGTGTPTGDVAVTTASAGAGPGAFPLANGSAVGSTAVLPGGTYTVTAHYPGDGVFAPSDSAPVMVTVAPEASITSAAALATFYTANAFYTSGTYGNDSLTLSARVAGRSHQGSPTGTVAFTDNGVPIGGPSSLNSEGQALSQDTYIVLPVGRHSIAATYFGDSSFAPSLSPPAVITITKAPTTISVQPSVSSTQATKTAILTATIETGSAYYGDSPTGTVAFSLGGKPLGGLVRVFPNYDGYTQNVIGVAVLTTSALPPGVNSITASYGGDQNYLGAVSQPAAVTVGTEAPACAVSNFTADPNPISVFDPPNLTTLNVTADCRVDIRIGGPNGIPFGSTRGNLTATTGPWVTDGMTFYLQLHDNSTAAGTLQKLTVSVEPGTAPCVVYSFAASPSPIIAPSLTGATTITGVASCEIDIRAGNPNGTLLKSGKYVAVAPTGDTVTNGAEFFLQQKGNTTPQGTLATLAVPVLATEPLCVVTIFPPLRTRFLRQTGLPSRRSTPMPRANT